MQMMRECKVDLVSDLRVGCVAAALSYSRWAMEMLTVVEYAGLDPSRQHLAMFQLAQMVRTNLLVSRKSTTT